MKTITHDGIDYRLTSGECQELKARYDYLNKFGIVTPRDANRVATVLTLERFCSEFQRSESDWEVINLVSSALIVELLI